MKTFFFRSFRISLAVPLIISINLLIYIFWLTADGSELIEMSKNYLVSWNALEQGRYWTLLSSAFSHNMFFHFFLNMFVLNSFGKIVEYSIGFKSFVRFYVIAGIISSFAHSYLSAYLLHDPSLQALGASGAVAGIILIFALMYPKQKILLLGIIPLPALTGALIFIGLDLWGLFIQAGGHGLPIGHGAHLGGAFTGVIYYFLFLRKNQKQTPQPHYRQESDIIDAEFKKID